MTNKHENSLPMWLLEIEEESRAIGFTMPSDRMLGSLLRTLVASKTGGRILELGTGTGLATAWLLSGMDEDARLITIDNDVRASGIAEKYLGSDKRVLVLCTDASNWVQTYDGPRFDLVFADTWAGKYRELDQLLSLLRVGGLYIIDDMEEQEHWSLTHAKDARNLIRHLEGRTDLIVTRLNWASGIILATKVTQG
jgi:predicted O-methyltransferase YrrM